MKINALKINNNVSIVLGTKHYHFTDEKAEIVFELAMEYKKNPCEESLEALQNEISMMNKLIHQGIIIEDSYGNFYLKDHEEIPLPEKLAENIIDYAKKGYPLEALINFWKLCMINPNQKAISTFYEFIDKHGITITDKGYAVLYKSVSGKEFANDQLVEFISYSFIHAIKDEEDPKKIYVISKDMGDYIDYDITNSEDDYDEQYSIVGNLAELHSNLEELIEKSNVHYSPHYKGGNYGNKIQLGIPVVMPRSECDPDEHGYCSLGLHVGARSYVRVFNSEPTKIILACLVNPMNIVAVPSAYPDKIECCEYYPYAVLSIGMEEWEEIDSPYFETDYCNYETKQVTENLSNFTRSNEIFEPEQMERLIDVYAR